MQTFVPHPSYIDSALELDPKPVGGHLGKQRVECLQIGSAILDPSYGWQNHTAVNMWRGHGAALLVYGMVVSDVWRKLGYRDSCFGKLRKMIPLMLDMGERITKPSWFGNMDVHDSHKGMLFGKDPVHYEMFYDYMDIDGYVWPSGTTRASLRVVADSHPLLCHGCKARAGFTNLGPKPAAWWVCSECKRPTRGWLMAEGDDVLHKFYGGPLDQMVYTASMILHDSRIITFLDGYVYSGNIEKSEKTGRVARVWGYSDNESPGSVTQAASTANHSLNGRNTMTATESTETDTSTEAAAAPVDTSGLLERRNASKFSRTQVAEAAGVTVAQLYRIEKGGRSTKQDEVDKVKAALDKLEQAQPAPAADAEAAGNA